MAGRQQLTHTWWELRRPLFDLVISQVVLDEVRAGDPDAAHMAVAAYHGVQHAGGERVHVRTRFAQFGHNDVAVGH